MLLASEKTRISPRAWATAALSVAALPPRGRADEAQPVVGAGGHELVRAVLRAVGGDEHLQAVRRVVEGREVVELAPDRGLLVARGDDDRDRRGDRLLAVGARAQPAAGEHERGEARVGVADQPGRQPEQQPAHRPVRPFALAAKRRTSSIGAALHVEASLDGAPALGAQSPAQGGADRQALQGPRERRRVAGRHEQAVPAVVDELGDPGDAAGHDGQAAAHGLHQDDGDALAPALLRGHARRDEHVGRGAGRRRPPRACAGRRAPRGPAGRRRRWPAPGRARSGPSPTRRQRHVDAVGGQQPAGLDEVPLALDLVQRPDAQQAQRRVGGPAAVRRAG